MSTKELLRAMYLGLNYRLSGRNTMDTLTEMAAWMKGVGVKELDLLAKKIVENYLLKRIRPEIVSEIAKHKEQGLKLGILSAALDVICEPIAKHLHITDVLICSKVQAKNQVYTGKIEGKLCYAEQKKIQLEKYCDDKHLQLNEIIYYADSISDMDVMQSVGYPICVSPDRKLRAYARLKSWETL
jgi:HAD superfamily hydrolase (TIGR01490 family)